MSSKVLAMTLLKAVQSRTYYPVNQQSIFDCNQGNAGSNDTCHIICTANDNNAQSNVYCGRAGTCIIDCVEEKCLLNGKINATGSGILRINATSTECMMATQTYLPFQGTAVINVNDYGIKADEIMKDAKVWGNFTNNITISCTQPSSASGSKEECRSLEVYAADAQYLEININGAEMNENSRVECPDNSAYEGVPCIINGTTADSLKIWIIANNGSPHQLLYYDNGNGLSRLQCKNGEFEAKVNSSTGTFENTICWIDQSPTVSPSTNPTSTPSILPSASPTWSHQSILQQFLYLVTG